MTAVSAYTPAAEVTRVMWRVTSGVTGEVSALTGGEEQEARHKQRAVTSHANDSRIESRVTVTVTLRIMVPIHGHESRS